jgi:hypothetical protein
MRELTVRLRFTKHSLGNVKAKDRSGRFLLPRGPDGRVTFLPTWHRANMLFAAKLLGRHQDEVKKICWDIHVDGVPQRDPWYRRYYSVQGSTRQRFVLHEAFTPGQVVGVNCAVPAAIVDDDLWRLMLLAGQYRGLSPWKPGEWGFFEPDGLLLRRSAAAEDDEEGGLKREGLSELPAH